jgi:TRAP-type C4-dicarboxylate transport system permease small subunit
MRVLLRVLIVVAVFAGVGWGTARAVLHHAAMGTPATQVRLSAAMAGLFAGGAAAVVAGIGLAWRASRDRG